MFKCKNESSYCEIKLKNDAFRFKKSNKNFLISVVHNCTQGILMKPSDVAMSQFSCICSTTFSRILKKGWKNEIQKMVQVKLFMQMQTKISLKQINGILVRYIRYNS